jgi:hypothetical protein
MPQSPPQPETITRLFDAVYPSFAMLVGMELDIFTPLKDRGFCITPNQVQSRGQATETDWIGNRANSCTIAGGCTQVALLGHC